jgi:hypothetical protein
MCKTPPVASEGAAAADMYVKYIILLPCEIIKGIFRLNVIYLTAPCPSLEICIYLQCAFK